GLPRRVVRAHRRAGRLPGSRIGARGLGDDRGAARQLRRVAELQGRHLPLQRHQLVARAVDRVRRAARRRPGRAGQGRRLPVSSGVRRGDALARPETGALAERFRAARGRTLALCEPLRVEDTVVQTMPDVSPTKWHLAHVTWFFERFVLRDLAPGYREFDARFDYLFNSYYETVGRMHPRAERGLLTRPTL